MKQHMRGSRTNVQKVVTRDKWRRSRDFERVAKPGDPVSVSVVDAFAEALPPVTMTSTLVQCGEPHAYAFDPEKRCWRETYTTFSKKDDGWYFCGYCFQGRDTEPKHISEGGNLR